MPLLKHKTVIVTGASSGLGLALAKKLLSRGATVFGVSRTGRNWKKAFAATRCAKRFFLTAVDLTQESEVKRFLSSVRKKSGGGVDLLINCAGYGGQIAPVDRLSLKELRKHLANNFEAAFLMCKYAIPVMKTQKRGVIVNISSMAGKRAVPRLAGYSAAKFGILALSQCIAKENADWGINCITVCPGGINTKMRAELFGKKDAAKQQSAAFVADVIDQILEGQIEVQSGGDIVIRHGKVTAVNPPPAT